MSRPQNPRKQTGCKQASDNEVVIAFPSRVVAINCVGGGDADFLVWCGVVAASCRCFGKLDSHSMDALAETLKHSSREAGTEAIHMIENNDGFSDANGCGVMLSSSVSRIPSLQRAKWGMGFHPGLGINFRTHDEGAHRKTMNIETDDEDE